MHASPGGEPARVKGFSYEGLECCAIILFAGGNSIVSYHRAVRERGVIGIRPSNFMR